MKIELLQFFRSLKIKAFPNQTDYRNVDYYLRVVEAFSLTTHQSVYLIDYQKGGFMYVSDHPLFLCGERPIDVKEMGYHFYQKYVPLADLNLLLQINEAKFEFYNKLAFYDRLNYTISYDFHLMQPNKDSILVNHKYTPLVLDDRHNIWLALCIVTHSPSTKAGNIIMARRGSNKTFEYNLETKEWLIEKKIKLTQSEKNILALTVKGFTFYNG